MRGANGRDYWEQVRLLSAEGVKEWMRRRLFVCSLESWEEDYLVVCGVPKEPKVEPRGGPNAGKMQRKLLLGPSGEAMFCFTWRLGDS